MGSECKFGHGEAGTAYKTRMCKLFQSGSGCPAGSGCRWVQVQQQTDKCSVQVGARAA